LYYNCNYYIPNTKNVILDYVLSNSLSVNVKNVCPKLPIYPLHPPIYVLYTYKHENLNFKESVFDWKSDDYKSIIKYFAIINWFNLFNSDINYSINVFYSYINYAINNFIPLICKYKSKYPKWVIFSKELKLLIKQKHNAHYTFKHQIHLKLI
jgi:hypothetical protein